MEDSQVVVFSHHADDPNVGLALNEDRGRYKMFLNDTGLFVTLALWAIVGFGVIALLSSATVETDNAMIAWLGLRLDILYIIFLIIGFFGIFYFYWKKPWDYLNEVIDATETVYEKSAKGITLSAPLHSRRCSPG